MLEDRSGDKEIEREEGKEWEKKKKEGQQNSFRYIDERTKEKKRHWEKKRGTERERSPQMVQLTFLKATPTPVGCRYCMGSEWERLGENIIIGTKETPSQNEGKGVQKKDLPVIKSGVNLGVRKSVEQFQRRSWNSVVHVLTAR